MDSAALTEKEISFLAERAEIGRNVIMQMALEPHKRRDPPVFTATRAADLLGRSRQSVSRVIQELGIGSTSGEEHTLRYSLTQDDLWALARKFSVSDETRKPAVVLAVINQKGGVGKTTTAIHLAHYAALLNLKCLAVDVDAQASLTAFQGLSPDSEVDEKETLFPILTGDHLDIENLIRPAPHFKNLSYIPACLALAPANELAYDRQLRNKYTAALAQKHGFKFERDDYVFFNRLSLGLDKVRDKYDLIILDTPPHITASTYNVLFAADFVLVPTGASIMDLASTLRFIDWVDEIMPMIPGLSLHRIKFLATNYDSQQASSEALNMMRQILGAHLLKTPTARSTEVQRAAGLLRSIYECPQPLGSRDAWARACESMDEVNREILSVVEEIWAIKQAQAKPA